MTEDSALFPLPQRQPGSSPSTPDTQGHMHESAPEFVTATVYGQPVPQGNMTAQRVRNSSRLVVYHGNADRLVPWREAVVAALRERIESEPWDGPCGIAVVFTMRKPKSAPKRKHVWPAKKPDLDKLLRGVMDAATAAGVWRDDSQVVMTTMSKHYEGDGYANVLESPGARIHVWKVTP